MDLLHRRRRDETSPAETTFTHPGPAVAAGLTRPPMARPAPARPAPRPHVARWLAPPAARPGGELPPSVARVAARTRLSTELLAAILEVDARPRATLDDIERADALAERLLARRADRQRAAANVVPASPVRPGSPRVLGDVRLAS